MHLIILIEFAMPSAAVRVGPTFDCVHGLLAQMLCVNISNSRCINLLLPNLTEVHTNFLRRLSRAHEPRKYPLALVKERT